jgi:parallel beta-helix repeat protein
MFTRGIVGWVMGKQAAFLAVLLASMVFFLFTVNFNLAEAQSPGSVCINPDGSVTGTSSIQRDGNSYTLTANISGGIQIQKSYVIIDGAGYAVDGNGQSVGIDLGNGVGQDPSRSSICNVTVKNLKIINCYYAIGNENTCNNTFIGNYIDHCDTGFWITGSANNTLIHNTVKNCSTGISINYCSGGNIITENNILSSWSVWLSPDPTVDRNYWSDYTTRFPNAKEIDNSGIWDTPYSHGDKVIDYHPLVKPVDICSNGNPEASDNQEQPTQTQEPTPTTLFAVAAGASVAVIGIALFLYFNKHSKGRNS